MIRLLLFILFALVAFNMMGQTTATVSYVYDDAGNRTNRVTKIDMSKSATVDTTEQVAPIEDQMNQLSVKIYPNPTKGMLKVDIVTDEAKYMTKIQ